MAKPKKKKAKKKEERGKKPKTEEKKGESKKKETIREAASRLEKDLESFMEIVEEEGTHLPPEELQGFEQRQFNHITSKIADAIIKKVGEKNFEKVAADLKSDKITPRQAAETLKIKLGDLVLALEARKILTEKQIWQKLRKEGKS